MQPRADQQVAQLFLDLELDVGALRGQLVREQGGRDAVIAIDARDLFQQDLHQFFLWKCFNNRSLLKKNSLAVAARNTDISLLGLSRAIYHTTHYGHLG